MEEYSAIHLYFQFFCCHFLSKKKKSGNTWRLDKWMVIPWESQLFVLAGFVGENPFWSTTDLSHWMGPAGPATSGGRRTEKTPASSELPDGTWPQFFAGYSRQPGPQASHPIPKHVQGCSAAPGSLQGKTQRLSSQRHAFHLSNSPNSWRHIWVESGLGHHP